MKRHEARNISLVANVSRDVLCKRFTAEREVQANALEAAALRLKQLQRSSWHAIAWEKHNVAPEGVRCTRAAPIHARMPATGGPPMPATGGPPKPATGGHPMPATDGHLATAATSPSSSSVSTSSVLKRRSSTMTSSEQTRTRVVLKGSQAIGNRRSGPATSGSSGPAASGSSGPATGGSSCQATGGSADARLIRDQCKAERSKRIEDAKVQLEQLRAPTLNIPCTRLQWAEWVGVNIQDLRSRMLKHAAPHRRRELSNRVCARPNLPTAVKRLRPQAEQGRATTAWGKLLEWRCGWYALQAASGRRMVYMVRHVSTTYVIDMEDHRVPGLHPYHLTGVGAFGILQNIVPLRSFELALSHDVPHTVYELRVDGRAADDGGTLLRPVQAVVVDAPAKYSSHKENKKDSELSDEDEAEDSCEDLVDKVESDQEPEEAVVDTDVASFDESGDSAARSDVGESTSTEEEDPATGGKPKGSDGPATGGKAKDVHEPATGGRGQGAHGPTIFDNGYFFIKGHELDLKMHIRIKWTVPPPVGLGRNPTMTRTITPSTVGETRKDPTRTLLLLKAWMLYRARGVKGWVEGSESRKRLFAMEEEQLCDGIRHLQPQKDGLLGNSLASQLLREWIPDVVSAL